LDYGIDAGPRTDAAAQNVISRESLRGRQCSVRIILEIGVNFGLRNVLPDLFLCVGFQSQGLQPRVDDPKQGRIAILLGQEPSRRAFANELQDFSVLEAALAWRRYELLDLLRAPGFCGLIIGPLLLSVD
jgi:hypothetical protein